MSSIRDRLLQGFGWISASVALSTALRPISKFVLAGLLVPEAFGILALSQAVVSLFAQARLLGFDEALIVSDRSPERSHTAFVSVLSLAVLAYIIVFALAPELGSIFNEPNLKPVLRLHGLILIINTFRIVPRSHIEKGLSFDAVGGISILSTVGQAIVSIGLALSGFGLWSLIWGELASAILSTSGYLAVSRYRPSLAFHGKSFRELFAFGVHVLTSKFAVIVGERLDDFVIGYLLGPTLLGYYTIALGLSNLPDSFGQISKKVLFPTFSQVDSGGKRTLLYLSIRILALATFPASLGLAVIAPELIQHTIGAKWLPSVPILRILVLYGLIRSITITADDVLKTTDRVQIYSRFVTIQAVLLVVLVYPATLFGGVEGTAVSLVVSAGVNRFGQLVAACQAVGISLLDVAALFGRYLAISGLMAISVYAVQTIFPTTGVLSVLSLIVVGIVSYAVLLLTFDRPFLLRIAGETRILARFV